MRAVGRPACFSPGFCLTSVALTLLALKLGQVRGVLDSAQARDLIRALYHIPAQMEQYLGDVTALQELAQSLKPSRGSGRGRNRQIQPRHPRFRIARRSPRSAQ